ncbi:SEC-C metal-binding domain-containing protein [Paraburkholderia fungorum]
MRQRAGDRQSLAALARLTKQIPASIAAIYRFWLPYRQAVHEQKLTATIQRTEPKVGRNDPCPCGSGKKFKKCCGAAAELH